MGSEGEHTLAAAALLHCQLLEEVDVSNNNIDCNGGTELIES
jgi:hypothetical protein